MLSISPLTIPTGSGDGAEGIASYLADGDAQYRSEGGAAPSMWLGGGAQALGLQGDVQAADHIALLQGLHPATGEPLGQKQKHQDKDIRCGWDCTLSPPKSFSAIWATAAEPDRAQLEAAHDRAVARAVAMIEQTVRCRQGKGGSEKVEAAIVAAAHRHSTSRMLDPQIHTHVSLLNLARRPDGTWGAVEVRDMYRTQRIVGAAYRAELAAELRALGYCVAADKAAFRIVGVPDAAAERWSQRRHQILDAVGGNTNGNAAAAERAALNTRGAKEHRPAEELHAMWQQQAAEMGWNGELVIPEDFHQATFQEALQAHLDATWQNAAVLKDRDLQRLVMESAGHAGVRVDEAFQHIQAAQEGLVRLTGQDGEVYWSTPEHMQTSRELRAAAQTLAAARGHAIPRELVDAQLAASAARGLTLSGEQEAAIRHLAEGGDLSLCQGAAGAGKTASMSVYCRASEAAGYRVLGLAPSGKAADQLSTDAGIEDRTIHSLLLRERMAEQEGKPSMLDERTIILVDEAGMLDSRLARDALALAQKSGAAVRLIGDDQQLSPVAAGSPFRVLRRDLGAAELLENRRQRHDWSKAAAKALRAGEAAQALAAYQERGWLHISESREAAQEEVVRRWAEAFDPAHARDHLMTAATNADVGALNEVARQSMLSGGMLEGPSVRWADGPREYAVGDRVLVRKNSREADVKNGQLGTVLHVDAQLITIALDNGRTVTLEGDVFDPSRLERGYAVSVHKSQGASVLHTYNLACGGNLDKLLAYVQGTRHKDSAYLVLVASDLERLAALAGVEIDGDMAMTPMQMLQAAAAKLGEAAPHEDVADFQVDVEPSAQAQVTSPTARSETRAAAPSKASQENETMSTNPNPERAQAARAHAAAWFDRSHFTRGRKDPSDAEILAWAYLHDRADSAGMPPDEAPIPDPRDVPEWAMQLREAARSASAAQVMRDEIQNLQGFCEFEHENARERAFEAAEGPPENPADHLDPAARWLVRVMPGEEEHAQADAATAETETVGEAPWTPPDGSDPGDPNWLGWQAEQASWATEGEAEAE